MNRTLQLPPLRQLEAKVSGSVLELTRQRPQAANALNTAMAEELLALFRRVRDQTTEIRCLLLTGSGSLFCAGADLVERDAMEDEDWHRQHTLFEHLAKAVATARIRSSPRSMGGLGRRLRAGVDGRFHLCRRGRFFRAAGDAEGDMQRACLAELAAYRPLVATADRREGVKAFREKRAPKFSGS